MNKDTVINGNRLTDMKGMKEKTVQGMFAFHDLLVEKNIISKNDKLRFSGGAEKGGGHKNDKALKDKNNKSHDPLSHSDGDKFDISYRDFSDRIFKGIESRGKKEAQKIMKKIGGTLKSRVLTSGDTFKYYEITHNGITMEIHIESNHFDIGVRQ